MRAQPATLVLVQGLFQQGPEDRRVDQLPVGARGRQQLADLFPLQGEDRGVLEEPAVEVADPGLDDVAELLALLHLRPQRLQPVGEMAGVLDALFQQRGEAAPRQQVGVLGEHREQAAHEKVRHVLGIALAGLQRLAHFGQPLCDLAGNPRRGLGRVERVRIGPDCRQPRAHIGVAQVLHEDPEALAVRILVVGAPGAGEIRKELQAVAHIAGDDERRRGMVGVQKEYVAFGLLARVLHHHVTGRPAASLPEGFGVLGRLVGQQAQPIGNGVLGAREAGLFRLQDEGALLVEVDPLGRGQTVAAARSHGPLEDIIIVRALRARGFGAIHAEHVAEFRQEHLIVGALGAALARRPPTDEKLYVHANTHPVVS